MKSGEVCTPSALLESLQEGPLEGLDEMWVWTVLSARRLPANAPAKSAKAVKSGHLDSTQYELKYEPLETAVEKTVSPQGHSLVALL